MEIKRSELVEGKKYYMDVKQGIIGVFKGRDEKSNSIYFDCGEQDKYHTSPIREGLVMFTDSDMFNGFVEVEDELQALIDADEQHTQAWRNSLTQEQINSI